MSRSRHAEVEGRRQGQQRHGRESRRECRSSGRGGLEETGCQRDTGDGETLQPRPIIAHVPNLGERISTSSSRVKSGTNSWFRSGAERNPMLHCKLHLLLMSVHLKKHFYAHHTLVTTPGHRNRDVNLLWLFWLARNWLWAAISSQNPRHSAGISRHQKNLERTFWRLTTSRAILPFSEKQKIWSQR